MKLIYIILLSVLFTTSAEAQECNLTLPGSWTVISQDTTLGNGTYWICAGTTVTFTAYALAVLEDGCTVIIDGFLGNYSFKPNCNVNITANAFNNIVVYDNTTTVVDNGTSTFPTLCDEVVIDYSNAPPGGCAIVTSVAESMMRPVLGVFPNPATDVLNFHSTGKPLLSARLTDLSGREVLRGTVNAGRMDISGVRPGSYLLVARTAAGDVVKPVIIQ